MSTASNKHPSVFGRIDWAVAFVALALLAIVLAPALAQVREGGDRTQCLNNARSLGLACLNFEAARRTMPLASTQILTGKPGNFADPDPAGFSWLVMTIPYLNRDDLLPHYERLAQTSNNFRKSPFDPEIISGEIDNVPTRDLFIWSFLCPSFIETLNAPAAEGGAAVPPNAGKLPAISNYHAMAGSHFVNAQGVGRMLPAESLVAAADGRLLPTTPFEGTGAMPFPGMVGGQVTLRGVRMSQISDGAARTFLFAETIEKEFASWMDGQVTWLVAAWPGTPDPPTLLPPVAEQRPQPLGWNVDQLPTNWTSLGKQLPPNAAEPKPPYLPANRWSGGKDRAWGPSSLHGNVVTHGFVDAHAEAISLNIDKNVYLHLATRAGREVIPENAF